MLSDPMSGPHGEVHPAIAGKKEDSATRLLRHGGDEWWPLSTGRNSRGAPGISVSRWYFGRVGIYICNLCVIAARIFTLICKCVIASRFTVGSIMIISVIGGTFTMDKDLTR